METLKQKFSLTRTFNAPQELVFDAFSNAEALEKWWGPVEAPIDVVRLDFRPGGIFHYRMKGDKISYGIFKFLEISRPNRIVWVNSFANEKAEIIKPPFEGLDFPKEILVSLDLKETEGVTKLSLTSEPMNASDAEIQTFNSIRPSMKQGFGGTFDQLENFLSEIHHS